MHLFIQACLLGILTGGVYALMASGLTLAFGMMKVINVAQGALIILGAYLSYTLFTRLHIDPFVGILIITPLMFALGVTLQLAFIRPLRADEREELSLLVTWAIALGDRGPAQRHLRHDLPLDAHELRERLADHRRLPLLGRAAARLRRLGGDPARAVPAAVADVARALDPRDRPEPDVGAAARHRRARGSPRSASASARRRPPRRARSSGSSIPFNPGSHYDLISRLLSIVVLGGLGSIGGAVIAALFMGVTEAVFAAEISPTWSSFTFFIVLIAVLLVRPQGLFGVRSGERCEPAPRSRRGPRRARVRRARRCSRSPSRRTGS